MAADVPKSDDEDNYITNSEELAGEAKPVGSQILLGIALALGVAVIGFLLWIVSSFFLVGSMLNGTEESPDSEISSEDRYHYIDGFLKEIDYKTAGVVQEEIYDNLASHPLNPARFEAVIRGDGSFDLLRNRIENAIPNGCEITDTVVRCIQNRPSVTLIFQDDETTIIELRDTGAGRD